MKEDYLWDKSGEPDAEIAELEQMLGRLRYKRPTQPLPLPATSRAWFRPLFSPAFAIAATLVILLLAGGLWFGLRLANSAGRINIASGPPPPVGPVKPDGFRVMKKDEKQSIVSSSSIPHRIIRHTTSDRQQTLAQAKTLNNMSSAQREEIARGQEAKAQLIKALLITSDKLNAVQKKVQGNQERNPIS
jgi:hypothetical protein